MVDLGLNDKIIEMIKEEGPVLPVKITKLMNTNILFASAKLSELVSKKIVRISHTKIGGSPVYYLSGQEPKLEMLYKYLAEKEKEAYNLLKEKRVLKDVDCEPGIRVAFRNIPDFAVAFKFNEELFWKWFLCPNEEAIELLKDPPKIVEEINEEEVEEKIVEEPKIKEEKPKIEKIKPKKEKIAKKKAKEDNFLTLINDYIKYKKYKVINEQVGKKNKEVYKTININSDLGELKYLLCAKNKKKISDSDLRLAYGKGQESKIPVLFLSSGELSKKAEKYLAENSLIVFIKV